MNALTASGVRGRELGHHGVSCHRLHPADAESAGGSHHQAAGHPGNGRYYDQ